ncbi:MAG: LamG domain-containing protein [Gammaproteobacteria bacterium]|nr:MAG: LamG domain-containing protein [Gammaproteobacteria bacterium]TLZ49870.1 MAG: LamG domain-containing protein [Gammaproteobacteria bacterium]
MNAEHLVNGFELIPGGLRALKSLPVLALTLLLITVAACSRLPLASPDNTVTGSGPGTGPGPGPGAGGGSGGTGYSGPAAANADVLSFQTNLWVNISGSDRCGGCHQAGGQAPLFARSDDVNLAYQATGPLVNFTDPTQSELVLKVGGGHNCFLASAQDCANMMTTWIKSWIGGTSSAAAGIVLTPPPDQSVGGSKLFPADSSQFQALIWSPILRRFCSDCHRPDAATPQTPYHASSDPAQAYIAAQPRLNLNTPSQSRFVVRLRDQFHHCWATAAGGAPDCPGSAAAMLAAITSYADQIPVTNVDPTLVLSRALSLKQGTPASGASRYEANLIAKYEFKTGSGSTAYDTSAVAPGADLTLTGIGWVSGWGISIGAGGSAQASASASQKLAQMIQSTGEYSIEVWATPANVAQSNAYIVTYSGDNTHRNMTLGQHAMQYEARTRSSNTDNNGAPALLTSATGMFAQASLQHVVLTYDAVNGQQIYVNGKYTGDADPGKGGTVGNWDGTFALVLGNETTGQRQWQGVIKFAAIHSRALTAAQVQQNFAAGVGERYYLLFNVSSLTGVLQSFIMMEASQYDSYSYLLRKPRFISLDPNATPANIPISGIRIGVNGTIASVGQSYVTVNATVGSPNYTFASGQLLSNVGAVIAADRGADSDIFFLSFDQLGSNLHPFVGPTISNPPMTADNTPRPDFGIATFERVNRSMSAITGVPITNPTVSTLYNSEQQSLPPASRIDAFLTAQQTAITQLATAYCGQLVDTQSLRDAFFGPGLDASITATSAAFFGAAMPNTTNRGIVINALIANAIGTNVDTTAATAAHNELDALLTRIPTLSATATVSQATKAACTAVLASAAVTLQ